MFTVTVDRGNNVHSVVYSVREGGIWYARVTTLEAAERIAQLLNESEGNN